MLRALKLLLPLLLIPNLALAAISIDSYASNSTQSASSVSVTHTMKSCPNSDGIVIVSFFYSVPGGPSGATYAGNTMTSLNSAQNSSGNVSTFYYLNPPAGSNTATVNYTFLAPRASIITAASYCGVSQSTPFRNPGTVNGTGNSADPIGATVTTVSGDEVIGSLYEESSSAPGAPTNSAGVLRQTVGVNDSGFLRGVRSAYSDATSTTASTAITWTGTTADQGYAIDILIPAGAAGGSTQYPNFISFGF